MPSSIPNNTNVEGMRGTVPEYNSGTLNEGNAMDASQKWLGAGYKDMGNGRFVSEDGLRQVRFGAHELGSNALHIHFEAYNAPYWNGGSVVENSRIFIVK